MLGISRELARENLKMHDLCTNNNIHKQVSSIGGGAKIFNKEIQ